MSGTAMNGGTTTSTAVPSAALGEPIACTVYLPPGYHRGRDRYPVLYLLHGRGDSMHSFDRAIRVLDGLIDGGRVSPVIAVAPDAPWSDRASWYVDSSYTGGSVHTGGSAAAAGDDADDANGGQPVAAGRPVETALVSDLVPAVDAAYRTVAAREGRLVGGYSMGGAGALRFTLAHQRLFAHALVLSPAVYVPLPPAGSNTRAFGAYGRGGRVFDEDVYRRLSYPALLAAIDPALPLHVFIAAGRGDYTDPETRHDIGSAHEVLYEALSRIPGVHACARVLPGGHDWDTWLPAFVEGLDVLGPGLRTAGPPTAVATAPTPDAANPVGAAPQKDNP